MADARADKPRSLKEAEAVKVAIHHTVDEFIAITGRAPSTLFAWSSSYNQQMDHLDRQVHTFFNSEPTGEPLFPRLAPWNNGINIDEIEKQIQDRDSTKEAEKLAAGCQLGKKKTHVSGHEGEAIGLIEDEQRILSPTPYFTPPEYPLLNEGTQLAENSHEQNARAKQVAELQEYQKDEPSHEVLIRRNDAVKQAEKSRLNKMIAQNLGLYKVWLNTIALTFYEKEQSQYPEIPMDSWDYWCHYKAPSVFEDHVKPEDKESFLLNKNTVPVIEGLERPVISYEGAVRARKIWLASKKGDISFEGYGLLNAINGENPILLSMDTEEESLCVISKESFTLTGLESGVSSGNSETKVTYRCGVDSHGFSI